jgi:hypothetical protein
MELKDVLKELSINGVKAHMSYCTEEEMFVLDLQTLAKSSLYLYESGLLKGRYGYETTMNLFNIDTLIHDLCYEFVEALHGRDFGNEQWFDLCNKLNVKY